MFFRFGAGLFLVVLVSLLGIAIEKRNLDLRRDLSRQHYRMDVLRDEHARLRLKCQQLAAVDRQIQLIDQEGAELSQPQVPDLPPAPADGANESDESVLQPGRRIPLLFFQRPLVDPRLRERPE
ncbi:MAG: hypothetical protein ACYTGL_10465 [Planctomycetota bacterium]|jgi:hypothetical protein